MAESDITQTRNTIGGDMAGGDIDKRITLNYRVDGAIPSQISRLSERFKEEQRSNDVCATIIGKLEHFSTRVSDEPVVGLEPKLTVAGYESQLRFAKQTKELFAKKLLETQFSESAQRIHAFLLAEVYSRFHRFICPLIQEGASLIIVSQAVQGSIIDPIQAMLEDNVLELYADEINGMLYFLTGNCHIKWTKEC